MLEGGGGINKNNPKDVWTACPTLKCHMSFGQMKKKNVTITLFNFSLPLSLWECRWLVGCAVYLQMIDVFLGVQINTLGFLLDGHDRESNVDTTVELSFLDLQRITQSCKGKSTQHSTNSPKFKNERTILLWVELTRAMWPSTRQKQSKY